ncbi:MAG: SPOR domain-containing protein, partial [Kiloniellales bacterium]|nr:SPOR domain-containing protein [Kiloniellales bacterium]
PNRQADPSAGQPDPFRHLLARLETGIELRRLTDTRWLLPAGIAACAVLLVAGLAVGIVPIPGDDRQTGQLAQDLEAPAAGDPEASAPLVSQQDLPVAPAGSEPDNESAVKPLPEEAAPGDEPGTSQLAALPEPGAPTALDSDREPIVDFMRIDPDGKAVVAGRAAPGTKLTVLDNGEPLGTVTADIYGLWTFVSKDPLSGGRHEIGLRVKNQGSEVSSEPVLVTDGGSSLIQGPESRAEPEGPVTNTPEGADFSRDLAGDFKAPEQLAAAAPGPSVRSDAAVPPGRAETDESAAEEAIVAPSRDDQGEIAATPTPIEDSLQTIEQEPVEPAAGPAEQAAEETLEVTAAEPAAAEAAATATAPAPAPKPEPPAETQIARAVPSGGDYVIQFASFLNPETAVREQALLEERFSDLLAGHDVFVQQVDIADQGTFYRVRLGPFATLAEARATCTRFQERERDCLAMAR